MEDALAATSELTELFRSLQDLEGQVSAFAQLSGLRLANQDSEEALKAAEEALDIAARADEAQLVGNALLALAEAHLDLQDGKEAQQAAEDAEVMFKRTGDEQGAEIASALIENAKKCIA